jgi:hypothetical protein
VVLGLTGKHIRSWFGVNFEYGEADVRSLSGDYAS